jgi:hypothetical protein
LRAKATIPADFAAALWIPTRNLAGGVAALGVALPLGSPSVNVSAVLTGPLGASLQRVEARCGDADRRSAGDRAIG